MSDADVPSPCSGPTSPSPSTTGSRIPPASARSRRSGTARRSRSSAPASPGVLCGYELMRMGVHPVLYESGQLGGRLRSQPFEGADGVIAELGGMRFPVSSTGFYHYVDKLGLESRPFPNPLTPAAGSTVIDLWGETHYAETLDDLPPLFREVATAYERGARGRARSSPTSRRRSATATRRGSRRSGTRSCAPGTSAPSTTSSPRRRRSRRCSFKHREVFGQVGFGTGGWDSRLPQLDARDPAGQRHRMRREPALHPRRRRAGAAGPVAPRAGDAWCTGRRARRSPR